MAKSSRRTGRQAAAQQRELAEQFFGLSPSSDQVIDRDAGQPALPLAKNVGAKLINLLRGGTLLPPAPSDPIQEQVDYARKLCREGNPFPLIAIQWPEFVIEDPEEAIFFEGTIGDPVSPCLRLDYWQRKIIAGFFSKDIREVFVKGCVGAGKGTASSLIFNLAFDVWDQCRIILTSTTYDHAIETIFAEVTKWRLKMVRPGPGKTLSEGIYHTKQHRIMVSNPLTGEGFSGKHGEMIVFGFDEASGVPDVLYTNALNQFHKIVALSNPRTQHGWFRKGFKPCADPDETQVVQDRYGKRLCVTVSGQDCANIKHGRLELGIAPLGGIVVDGQEFTEGVEIPEALLKLIKPLIPNQSDLSRYRGLLADPDPREVAVKAHGKFPTEDLEKQVILASWLPFHENAWHKNLRVDAFGLDVAAFVDDNVLTAGGKDGVRGIHRYRNLKAIEQPRYHTMNVVAWVIRTALEVYNIDLRHGRVPICVDCDGIGKGVGDRLGELGCWVIPFQGNVGSEVDPRRYANQRAEGYGEFGRRLDNHGPWGNEPFALPSDRMLFEELCTPEKIYDSSGERFRITPKSRQHGMPTDMKTVKELLGRSPDTGDSVVYMFHAVRKLDLWSSLRPPEVLTVSPAPAHSNGAPANGHANGQANGHAEINGDTALLPPLDGDGSVTGTAVLPPATNPQAQEMLDYLRRRYS